MGATGGRLCVGDLYGIGHGSLPAAFGLMGADSPRLVELVREGDAHIVVDSLGGAFRCAEHCGSGWFVK